MKLKRAKLITFLGLTFGHYLFGSNSAQAANFTTNVSLSSDGEIVDKSIFSDDENYSEEGINETIYSDIDTTKDIYLKSITQKDQTFSNFSFVNQVEIKNNDEWTGGNTGVVITDRGDKASAPSNINKNLTNDNTVNITRFLSNNNLNNIIDTDDCGTFEMNLFFGNLIKKDNTGLDSLFFFERGMDSHLRIQAINSEGNTIGNQIILKGAEDIGSLFSEDLGDIKIKDNQEYTGININTKEIDNTEKVGSWGVSLDELGVNQLNGIRVYADYNYNGPDFKVIARKSSSGGDLVKAKVPEPGTIIGLGSVAALGFVRRRKRK